jgi:hypothetical protein
MFATQHRLLFSRTYFVFTVTRGNFCMSRDFRPSDPGDLVIQIDYYGVRLRLWTAATNGYIVHHPDDVNWRTTMGCYWQVKTEEFGEKPIPVPLCPPQIPHRLTRARTRTSTVRGRWLTAWAMVRPSDTDVSAARNQRRTQYCDATTRLYFAAGNVFLIWWTSLLRICSSLDLIISDAILSCLGTSYTA